MASEKKYEVVISGMAGLYPECENIDELWSSLMNKEDLITVDSRRWTPGEFDVPSGIGKIKHPEKFDMQFFGVHRRLCEKMDPYCRLMCEQAIRAICDAGVNPGDLDGTNAACVMTSYISEPENDLANTMVNQGTYNVLAVSRTMQANRISYYLNLVGPSFQLDWQGHGGIQAIRVAHDLIASGACTTAIVGSCSIAFKPDVSFHYKAMGKLSDDSVTRSFSADAKGYARSEGCVTLFLQRKEQARRIYGTVMAAECFSFGSKDVPFTEFSAPLFEKRIREVYTKAKVDPSEVTYIEAYGSASRALDAKELNTYSRIMLKGRKEPLLIGSAKSNLGHAEGASSLVCLSKVLLALDNEVIPPNLHYKEPNPDVPDLVNGKIKVVTEPTPLKGDHIVALSEIGFCGNAGHVILKKFNPKIPSVQESNPERKLPLLITMSGRVEQSLQENVARLDSLEVDQNFTVLANKLFREGIRSHAFRAYTVLNGSPNKYKSVQQGPGGSEARPIWFMYSGMGSQWPTMAKSLMDLPVFAKAINRCHQVLLPKGVNLLDIVTKDDPHMFDIILNSFVGIAAVQIGLTDVLKAVSIQPDGIIGHSVGELGCAYADGCLTADEMILSAHARGQASIETKLIKGMMAAVGAGYKTIKNSLPETIEVACHNSKDSCTLSGPAEDMDTFISQLKAKGMFAKLVNVADIAYHSRYIKPAAPALLKYLKEIITVPRERSPKWLSSSIPEPEWGSELAKYSGAEYHTNNLLNSVLFEETSAHVPSNAIVIEIAPHGLLQAIVKKSMPQAIHVPLTSRFDPDNLMFMLAALGKLYIAGVPLKLEKIYPQAVSPVPPGTRALSPFIDWLHTDNFYMCRREDDPALDSPLCKYAKIDKEHERFEQIVSNKINGIVSLPLSMTLEQIIELFHSVGTNEKYPLVIRKLIMSEPIPVPEGSIELRYKLFRGGGNLVVNNTSNDGIVAECELKTAEEGSFSSFKPVEPALTTNAISRESALGFLKAKGAQKEPSSSSVDDILILDGSVKATAQWNGNLSEFIATCITLVEFYATQTDNVLKLFHSAGEIKIDWPHLRKQAPQKIWIEYNLLDGKLKAEGIEMELIECRAPKVNLSAIPKDSILDFELPQFVPYVNNKSQGLHNQIAICSQLIQENTTRNGERIPIKLIEIGQDAIFHSAVNEMSRSHSLKHEIHTSYFSSEEAFFRSGSNLLLQKNIWLVMPSLPTKDLVSLLSVVDDGFILMPKTKNGLFKNSNVKIVYEALVGNEWFAFYSIGRKTVKLNYIIVPLKGDYLQTLENQLLEIQPSDDQNVCKAIFLCGEVESLLAAENILEETEQLPNHHHLYYWLSVGKSESFNQNSVFFKAQIERNVRMNISVDGSWGSIKLLPTKVSDEHLLEKGTNTFFYPLSAVATGDVIALGLNPADDPDDGLGVYDYVSKTNMGVGIYDPHLKTFKADTVLTWSKPNYWTAEESATAPFLYSMASYIIHHINQSCFEGDGSILINRALTPLSQALISLALYENLIVHATVYGDAEKTELLKLFPELNQNFIYDCTTTAFFVDVLHNSKGIYKVINNFDDPQMIAPCAKCVMPLGTLIYVNQSLINSKAKMGMAVFIFEVASWGATSDTVMNSSEDVKREIQKNIAEALNKRAIKPIRTVKTLDQGTINTETIALMKNSNTKYVVNTKNAKITNTNLFYIKDEGKSHVVVEGKVQNDLSLDVVEWLLSRGSKKVIVFMRQIHPYEANAIRLQTLRDHYRLAEIDVRSTNQLSSKVNIEKFVIDCKSPGIVFFVGSGLKEKIELFDSTLTSQAPNCSIICIGKGGEVVCERRKKASLPALYVRCSVSTLESIHLPNYLDDMLNNSANTSEFLISKKVVQSQSPTGLDDELKHVPRTLSELRELFLRSPPTAKFVEIPTHSTRKQFSHDIYPIFLFPGLRPKRFHQMAKKLFCPALEARIPMEITELDQIAADFAHQLLGYNQNMYTLVGENWGGIIALQIAAKLDALSKIVNVILLDGTPASINRSATELLKNDLALIENYLLNSVQIPNIRTMAWAQKVNVAVNKSTCLKDEEEREAVVSYLNSLVSRLQAVVSTKPPPNKLTRSFIHVFRLASQTVEDDGLDQFTTKAPTYYSVDAETVEDMLNESTATTINRLNLLEYKDAACPPILEYLNQNVIKNPKWMVTRLFRSAD